MPGIDVSDTRGAPFATGSTAEFWRQQMTQYIRKMRAALCTAFVATALVAASAQTVTGSIRGLVTDPSGAVVPGGEITAINVNTGVKTKPTTDKTGNYNTQAPSVGSYKVTAARTGFKT